MIKCRQRAGGRGGRQRWRGKREGEREAEKEAPTSSLSDMPAPPWAQHSGTWSFCTNTVPRASQGWHTTALGWDLMLMAGVTCPCLPQAAPGKHKELLQNNGVPPHKFQGSPAPRLYTEGLSDPNPSTEGLCDCRCQSSRCQPRVLLASPSCLGPAVAQAPSSPICSSTPSLPAPNRCHSNFSSFCNELTWESEEGCCEPVGMK